ncbi:hypothetical protein I4F81_005048 [Pyropia yezoensis]|uniref:Uncharacterized protein n=1 Tax=Pyropia yezoensis TaxID=2788 RepID=A0ACC3BX60_PYRYE|nr:hypothetical protein I4F81_005048 [Neopyropia yezoensis]
MGNLLSVLWSQISGVREVKICMLGLDGAGKTTLLYALHLGTPVATHPTIGSNVEELTRGALRLRVWDLGGQASLRPSWRAYFDHTAAVIMVVDAADPGRFGVAAAELAGVLAAEELADAALLVYANKQDVGGAVGVEGVADALGLAALPTGGGEGGIGGRPWHIQGCSALTREGIGGGIDWIVSQVAGK